MLDNIKILSGVVSNVFKNEYGHNLSLKLKLNSVEKLKQVYPDVELKMYRGSYYINIGVLLDSKFKDMNGNSISELTKGQDGLFQVEYNPDEECRYLNPVLVVCKVKNPSQKLEINISQIEELI